MEITESRLPRRNWPLAQAFGKTLLRIVGWRFAQDPPDLSKAVIAVAPHTSNWDFFIGMAAALALDLEASWLAKHTIFNGPWGFLLRKLGGIPVDRNHPHGVLEQLIADSEKRTHFIIGIAPEGTRKPTSPWKIGCYRVAHAAKIPLVPAGLDYRTRKIFFLPHWIPGDNQELEMNRLSDCYQAAMAKKPENFRPHSQNTESPKKGASDVSVGI
jgi:1-acyl-sn-glycerol-3-phosphate acyltransferase